MTQYNIPPHKKGDTFNGVQFSLTKNNIALDLTNCFIKMDIRNKSSKERLKRMDSNGGGLTISNPSGGVFLIDQQIIDIPAAMYEYDIEFTFPNNTVKTYIYGNWNIIQDVTYD